LTALILASSHGHLPVVKLLLERGADPTVGEEEERTPLSYASCRGHHEVVRFLLGHPVAKTTINNRDCYGSTALSTACSFGRGAAVRALLACGADPTIADQDGDTPMASAKQQDDRNLESLGWPSPEVLAEGRRECVVALEV
jgi:uncharacterized protein